MPIPESAGTTRYIQRLMKREAGRISCVQRLRSHRSHFPSLMRRAGTGRTRTSRAPVRSRHCANHHRPACAREVLGTRAFRVLSIGFNQPFDGPDALAEFAQRQRIDDTEWLFVAPREHDVDPLLQRFGLTVQRTPSGFDHLIQASIVDRRGVIVQQVYGDKFDPPMLIYPLRQVLADEATEALSVENIWTRVRLYCRVYDPYTGNYKLDYSFFFELFAGVTTLGAIAWFLVRGLRRA